MFKVINLNDHSEITIPLDSKDFNGIGVSLIDSLIASKFVQSKNEAKREIVAGSIRLNNIKITNIQARICMDEKNTGFVIFPLEKE